jgi:hypothetical protein
VLSSALPPDTKKRFTEAVAWIKKSVAQRMRTRPDRVRVKLFYEEAKITLRVSIPATLEVSVSHAEVYKHATAIWNDWLRTNPDLEYLTTEMVEPGKDTRALNSADFAQRMRALREKNRGSEEAEEARTEEAAGDSNCVWIWNDYHGGAQF